MSSTSGLAYMPTCLYTLHSSGRLPDDLLVTLHSLSAKKLCYSRVIGTSLQFNLLCHRAAIARLHDDRRSIRPHEARETGVKSLHCTLYSLIFVRWYLPELHYYTAAGMHGGHHFRHRVCECVCLADPLFSRYPCKWGTSGKYCSTRQAWLGGRRKIGIG